MAFAPLLDKSRRRLLVIGLAAFFLLGAQQALYGPSFPQFRVKFGLDVDQVSAVVSAQFLGAFLAIVASALLLRLLGYRRTLLAGSAGVVLGLAGIAVAGSWWQVVASALVAGLGFGLLNVSFNLLLALAFRPNAAPALNVLNAVFGIGAVVGPLMVAFFEPRLGMPFGLTAAFALVLLLLVLKLKPPEPSVAQAGRAPFAWGLVTLFVLLYFFYVSTEAGVASWQTEHLAPVLGATTAAGLTALFWGAMTVGRFIAAPLSAYVRPPAMVLGSATLTVLFLLLAHYTPGAPIFYAAVGLSLAPIFGSALAWLTDVFPDRAEQVTPVVIAAANLGPVLTAPLIGFVVAGYGAQVIPTALAVAAVLLLVFVATLFFRTRR